MPSKSVIVFLILCVYCVHSLNDDEDYSEYEEYLVGISSIYHLTPVETIGLLACAAKEAQDKDDNYDVEFTLPSISIGKLTGLTAKGCTQCSCGIPNRLQRIVGGWMTEVHEYPWMVALSRKGHFFCGGTLINDEYVLTAAHCVARNDNNDTSWVKSNVLIILGEHHVAQLNETHHQTEKRRVVEVTVHPNFEKATFDHDLALLKLNQKVTFRHGLRTACLPPKDSQEGEYDGEWATVAGWGLTSEGGSASAYLRETKVPILSLHQCRQRGYRASRITQNMICAGDHNNMDSCQGDSGGALLVTNSFKQMMTVGIVSWGEGCARPKKPGVYTRVDKHVDWILENTQEACYCY